MTYQDFRASQKQFQSIDGGIKYIDKGEGDVIVLLHGIPTSGWLYRKMIDTLAQNHRVIVPDMLGFGNSASPKGYEIYSEENHAARLLALMDSLQIERWTHVFHDAGGLWTWELFKKAPNRIKKLVVLNTIIYDKGFKPPIRFKKGLIADFVMWTYRNGLTTGIMLGGLFKSGMTKNTLEKSDLEGYKTPLLEGKTNGMYHFFTQTCQALPNYKEVLQKINLPTIVIWGENDSFLKWEPQKEEVKSDLNISTQNIHLLDAKHFIQEEQPEQISAYILEFLN